MARQSKTAFGKKLETEIAKKKWTEAEFCRRAKMLPPQLVQLKKTKHPRPSTIKRISKVLGTTEKSWKVVLEKRGQIEAYFLVVVGGKEHYFRLPEVSKMGDALSRASV